MLSGRSLKVSDKFHNFVQKISPWFLEEGSLTLEYWKRVGKDMRKFHEENRNGTKPTVPMLLGQKDYAKRAAQLKISKAVLEKISQIAVSSWQSLPPPGAKSTVLSGIRQKHDESYESFVARLEEAVSRMLPPSEGTDILIKQLAWEYVNTLCQDLNRPIHKTSSLQDYIKACVDASPAVIQGGSLCCSKERVEIRCLCQKYLWNYMFRL